MNTLTIFRQEALHTIRAEAMRGTAPEELLGFVRTLAADQSNTLSLSHAFPFKKPALGAKPTDDGCAAELIYKWLGPMTPVQAADPRLWTYLAFVEFPDYMNLRWPLGQRGLDRWLMTSASRPGLVRHGMSRLWWTASLFVDKEISRPLSRSSKDPFAYTKLLLGNQDRFVAIMERDIGLISELAHAIAEHIAESAHRQPGMYARALMKELTMVAAYREPVILPGSHLHQIVEEAASRVPRVRLKVSRRHQQPLRT